MAQAFVADYRDPELGEDAGGDDTYRFEAETLDDAKSKAEAWCLGMLGDEARTVELRLLDGAGTVLWKQKIVQDDSDPD